LYYDIAFREADGARETGRRIRGQYAARQLTRRRLLDLDSELAAPVPELLYKAITEVYYADGGKHPKILRDDNGKPTIELIEETPLTGACLRRSRR
jgi:hypothetical protein